MKRIYLSILLLTCLTSCRYFDTEKISSETFYEEEIKTINWDDVDQYPVFKSCQSITVKAEQKNCFQQKIAQAIQLQMETRNFTTLHDIDDLVKIHLRIEKTGEITLKEIAMDSLTEQSLPLLREVFENSIYNLPKTEPAIKRGIPVTTEFIFPVAINSNNL